jgi:hypothetical protein
MEGGEIEGRREEGGRRGSVCERTGMREWGRERRGEESEVEGEREERREE